MAGGTLDLGGFNHTMNSTTLGLTASSTLLLNGGSSTFANSSALTWSGTLDLADADSSAISFRLQIPAAQNDEPDV